MYLFFLGDDYKTHIYFVISFVTDCTPYNACVVVLCRITVMDFHYVVIDCLAEKHLM